MGSYTPDLRFDDYLYGRISEDDIGTEKNVARQLRNSRAKSAVNNGHILGEWYDNDISALKGAPRPGFEKLMAAVTAPNPERRQRRIICQHTSRLWRNRGERAHGIDALGRAKIIVLPIDGPQLDLTSAAGRMIAGMLGEVDTGESETKGERIKDAVLERAQEGRTNGQVNYGWMRQYQYDARGKVIGWDDVVHPTESLIVQEVVARLLGGETLSTVTADLNARKVRAPRAGHRRKRGTDQDEGGTRWGRSSVRKIAIRDDNIGMRIYHRGQDDEQLMPAAWPALIDIADHNNVRILLKDPDRRTNRQARPGARVHLLTWGIGACGECGSCLRVFNTQSAYKCEARGCVVRNENHVDDLVSEVMVRLLSSADALQLLAELRGSSSTAADSLREARQLQARLDRAAEDYAGDLIEAGQLRLITARLRPQIAELKAAAEQCRVEPYLAYAASVVGPNALDDWAGMEVTQRRAVLQAFRMRVFIDRVTRRGRGFDPESVRILPGWEG